MRIYWKIFAGFWVATFLMVSAAMLAGHLMGTDRGEIVGPPHRLLRLLERSLALGGLPGLVSVLERYPSLDGGGVVVVDGALQPVYPDQLPRRWTRHLAGLAAREGRGGLRRFDGVYFMRPVRGPAGEDWRLALRLPPRWLRPFREHPLVRYGTALVVSGLVCYLLALAFTRRLERLSATTRQLAEGRLEARVPLAPGPGRGDEIQELARDFNRMAERLQSLVAGQEHLIVAVSHELRSPLARMQLLLALAHRKSPESAWPELGRLELEVERLGRIVSDLLLLPRLEQRDEMLEEMIDLAGLLDALVADWRSIAGSGAAEAVALAWRRPALECLVRGRATLLRSVFQNGLDNARRHAPPGSSIDLSLEREDSRWVVTIRDRGPGVAAEDLERIFEPFYRGSEARERETGGVGLGLALARRVVLAHGGQIDARLAAPGLALRVVLPVVES